MCIIINFHVLWFIRLSPSPFHFNNGTEYLILLIRCQMQSLVLKSFLVLPWYHLPFFFHLCLFDSFCLHYSELLRIFPLFKCSDAFLFSSSIPFAYPALAGPSGIRAGWGIEINGRFEAERPPALNGPPSRGRAATLTPLSSMYSTRHCCLV